MTNKLVVGISLLLSAFLFSCNTGAVLPKPSDMTLTPTTVTAKVNAAIPDPAAVLSFTNSGSVPATYTLSVAAPNATSIKLTGANALGTISGVVAPKVKASVNIIGAKCPATPGTYTSTIQGQDATTTVKFSNTFTLVCTALPPAAPTNFTATLNNGSINLSWTAVTGATSYNIERKTGTGAYTALTTQTGTSYTDATTSAGNTYTYRIQSVNAGGVSAWVESTALTVPVPAPSAPTSISAVLSGSAVTVSWPAATGTTTYELQRSVDGGAYSTITTQTGLSYLDPTTAAGSSYTYRVRAVNAGGASAWAESGAVIVPLAAPTNLLATLNSNNSVANISWNAITGATGYDIERKTGTGNYAALASVTTPAYADASVQPGNTYTYRVRATKGSVVGAWVESNSVTTANPSAIFESLSNSNPDGSDLLQVKVALNAPDVKQKLTVKNGANARLPLKITGLSFQNVQNVEPYAPTGTTPPSSILFDAPTDIAIGQLGDVFFTWSCKDGTQAFRSGEYTAKITVTTSDPVTPTRTALVKLTCAAIVNFRVAMMLGKQGFTDAPATDYPTGEGTWTSPVGSNPSYCLTRVFSYIGQSIPKELHSNTIDSFENFGADDFIQSEPNGACPTVISVIEKSLTHPIFGERMKTSPKFRGSVIYTNLRVIRPALDYYWCDPSYTPPTDSPYPYAPQTFSCSTQGTVHTDARKDNENSVCGYSPFPQYPLPPNTNVSATGTGRLTGRIYACTLVDIIQY